jgi:3'(2'), 5'-bisphosphate nucleotidase
LTQIPEIYLTAMSASIEASSAIMEIYRTGIEINTKEDGSPVTQADLASCAIISRHLKSTNIPIVGEELEELDFSIRSLWQENWLVDPLDGTKMFILKNDEFSINIAHIVDGTPAFGIITSPVEQKILIGGPEYGVFTLSFDDITSPNKWTPITATDKMNQPLVVTCSRRFYGTSYSFIEELEKKYGKVDYIKKGSALKFFDLAEGNADLYARFAPTMEWDIAAGQAILSSLGGEIHSMESNTILNYNKESLYNPHFLAKTKAFLDA